MINSIETIGLRVEGMAPAAYSTGVDVNQHIEIEFNSELDVKTISGNVYVLKDTDRRMFGRPSDLNITDFDVVKGSLTYSKERTVIFTPVGQLERSTRYIVYIPSNSLRDIRGRDSITSYIAFFDTDGYAAYPPCGIVYPKNNEVIHELSKIELDNLGAERYVIQISKNKTFENGLYDKVVDLNTVEDDFNLGEGSYYLRARATNGVFGETSFFTIRTIPNTLVSDEDEVYMYQPIEDEEEYVELDSVFPEGVNVHEMTNVAFMKFNGIIPIEEIDFYESGLFHKTIDSDEFSEDSVDGTFSVLHDDETNLTYVAFIPEVI